MAEKNLNNSDIQLLDAHGVPIGPPIKKDDSEIDLSKNDEENIYESKPETDDKNPNQDKTRKPPSDRKNEVDNNRNRKPRRRKRRSNYQGRDEKNSGNKD